MSVKTARGRLRLKCGCFLGFDPDAFDLRQMLDQFRRGIMVLTCVTHGTQDVTTIEASLRRPFPLDPAA